MFSFRKLFQVIFKIDVVIDPKGAKYKYCARES